MFKKSLVAVAILGAFTLSANSATVEEVRVIATTAQNNAAHALIQNSTQDRNIAANKTQIDQNAQDIAANKAEIGKIEHIHGTQIKDLQSQQIENTDAINTNKNNIAANKTQIDQNAQDIAANKAEIGKIEHIHGTQIKDLQSQQIENTDAINTNKNNIAANKTQIDQNAQDIHGLQQDMVENQMHDHAQDQNIGVNKNNIEKNQQAIEQNKQNIADNTQAIANNYREMKNNFAAVNSRIDNLDEEMKKGFASQAALNGLFQPYNVGKFNLSVALGGYESEQAMALGTGYRFNENFAMKAGIATDVGGFDHLTYNVGANFEW